MEKTNVNGFKRDEMFGSLFANVAGLSRDLEPRIFEASDKAVNNINLLNNKKEELGIAHLSDAIGGFFREFHEANPHCLRSKMIAEHEDPVKALIHVLSDRRLTELVVESGNGQKVNLSQAKDANFKETSAWARMAKHFGDQPVTAPKVLTDEFIRMFTYGTSISPYAMKTAAARTLSLFYEKSGQEYVRKIVVPLPISLAIGTCECCASEATSYGLSDMLHLIEAYDEGTFKLSDFKEREKSQVHFATHAEVLATDARYGVGTMGMAFSSLQNHQMSVLMPVLYVSTNKHGATVRFDRACMRCYRVFFGAGGNRHILNTLKLNRFTNDLLASVKDNHKDIREVWKTWSRKGEKSTAVRERLAIRSVLTGKAGDEAKTDIEGVTVDKGTHRFRAVTPTDIHNALEGILKDFSPKSIIFAVRKGDKLFGKRSYHIKTDRDGTHSLVGISLDDIHKRIQEVNRRNISEGLEL